MTSPDLSIYPETARLDADGRLTIGGCVVADVAREFGTPVLVADEEGLRAQARRYLTALRSRHPATEVYFASKAFAAVSVERILAEEGVGCDVASGGELVIALAAGVAPERILMHGNAKTTAEIAAALDAGIGRIVIDNTDDIDRIVALATRPQRVLLRVSPGIAAATHEAMATGHDDSKFGVSFAQAPALIDRIRSEPLLELEGIHAHIGSQIYDLGQFEAEVAALATLGRFAVYDLGGGLGVRYVGSDKAPTVEEYAEVLISAVHEHLGEDVTILVEPGRSMVASSVVTVYSVVTVKHGTRTHVAVDGGMGDNLEVSLYGQAFEPAILDRTGPTSPVDVVGRHCESGDTLVRDAPLVDPQVGDLLVVPVVGAYTYVMSNNYNGALRPPVVFCRDGVARLGIRRETFADLMRREV